MEAISKKSFPKAVFSGFFFFLLVFLFIKKKYSYENFCCLGVHIFPLGFWFQVRKKQQSQIGSYVCILMQICLVINREKR